MSEESEMTAHDQSLEAAKADIAAEAAANSEPLVPAEPTTSYEWLVANLPSTVKRAELSNISQDRIVSAYSIGGQPAIDLCAAAVRQGISIDAIFELLSKYGPAVLAVIMEIVRIINEARAKGDAAKFAVSGEVTQGVLLEGLLRTVLPILIRQFGAEIAKKLNYYLNTPEGAEEVTELLLRFLTK